MTRIPPPLAGLHRWHSQPQPRLRTLAAPRVWAIPCLAILLLALIELSCSQVQVFFFINSAANLLPEAVLANITALGDTLVAFAILLPLIARRPEAAGAALIAVLLAALTTHAIKYGLNLPRPAAVLDHNLFHIIGPQLNGRALPSGHSTSVFAVAALVVGHTLRWRYSLPIALLALTIGLSRIAVGAHWPADILAGAAIGWLSGILSLHLAAACALCRSKAIHAIAILLFLVGTLWLLVDFDSGYAAAHWLERGIAAGALLLFSLSLLTQRRQP